MQSIATYHPHTAYQPEFMKQVFEFTGDQLSDWEELCRIWRLEDCVMSPFVGPMWVMPPQHKVCLEFAEAYRDSKNFLLERLLDPYPRIAAYAFKALIRLRDVKVTDIPPQAAARRETVKVLSYSRTQRQSLRRFFARHFASAVPEALPEADARTISWQDNELAQYQDALRNRAELDKKESGT